MDYSLGHQNFYQEICQPQIDLAKAALHIAQQEYPQLDPASYLHTLDTMADKVRDRLPERKYPLQVIRTINEYLFDDLGFTGNTADYYNPCNSFLNDVLDRRTGIPIALSLVYLEIAKRLEFPMAGIGMPGHFLIRPVFEDAGIFVDPFHRGEILFPQDCEDRLEQIYNRRLKMSPSLSEPVSPKRFLARMLNNLKLIYLKREDIPKALGVVEAILLLSPESPQERRDRGLLYFHLDRIGDACRDLEMYLMQVPLAEDASAIRKLLEELSQK